MQPDPKILKEFERWGKTPPTSEAHGTEEDVRNNMIKLRPKTWVLEGNKLIGHTEHGPVVQYLPTNYICTGVDDDGLPKLQKIKQ